MSLTSLLLLLLACTSASSQDLDLDKELENFQEQLEKVAVKHIKTHEGDCRKTVEQGDRVGIRSHPF